MKVFKIFNIFFIIILLFSCKPSVSELIEAIQNNDSEEVSKLVENGVNIDNEEGELQPLELAINDGNEDLSIFLINNGADANIVFSDNNYPLQSAFEQEMWETINALIKNGVDLYKEIAYIHPIAKIELTDPLAFWAASNGNEELIKLILDNGFNINYQNKKGHTLLHRSLISLSNEMIIYLIENGANLKLKDEDNETPLEVAISIGNIDKIKLLLRYYNDLLKEGFFDETIYTSIAWNWEPGFIEIADQIYEAGIPLSGDNFLALHYAAGEGVYEFAKWLLEHGADPNKLDDRDLTPLNYANVFAPLMEQDQEYSEKALEMRNKKDMVIDLLIEYGAIENY